ncbi:MAG: DUF4412 domain-containing protein [candidate division WOR-3 bacterium]
MRYLIGVFLLLSISFAGIVYKAQVTDYDATKKHDFIQEVYLEKDKIRIDIKNEETSPVIFLGDKEILITVDHKNKTYTVLTKETAQKITKAAEEAFKAIEPELKKLPQEFQDKIKTASSVKKPQIDYKKVGGSEKIGNWICDKYVRLSDGEKDLELWTVDPKLFKLNQEDLVVFKKLKEFFGFSLKGKITTEVEFDVGFPVKIISYKGNKPASEYLLKELKEEKISPQIFEVPKGYKKEVLKPEK